MARPAVKREAVRYVVEQYRLSCRRACAIVKHYRSAYYYRSWKDPKTALRGRMRELAQIRIGYGYRRLHVLLKREGWRLGKHQAYRLYSEERLQLRSKLPRRRKMVVTRREKYVPKRPNQAWSMNFVADQLVDGTRFRSLTTVDVCTRESLDIRVGQRLKAEDVVEVCNRLAAQRGAPVRIFVDNGSEFSGRIFDLWAYHHKAAIAFNRPGRPTDNSFMESFNGSFRDECLNVYWFETIDEAKEKFEARRVEYNESRPHQARLCEMTPAEHALQCRTSEQRQEHLTAGN